MVRLSKLTKSLSLIILLYQKINLKRVLSVSYKKTYKKFRKTHKRTLYLWTKGQLFIIIKQICTIYKCKNN
jgi:hypothetical protein